MGHLHLIADPRHNEIDEALARHILKYLGVTPR